MTQAPVIPTSSTNVICFSCGYSLAGLPPEGLCPECGLPIARSLSDDKLVNSSPEYLNDLHRGTVMILTYLAGSLILGILGAILGFAGVSGAQLLATIGSLGLAAVSAYGWWSFSEPDPKLQFHGGQKPRQLVRITTLVQVVLALVSFLGTLVSGEFATATQNLFRSGTSMGLWTMLGVLVALASMIAGGVHFFSSMLYVRWLAPRIPNDKVFRRAKRFMWLGPVLMTVGLLLLGLGPLIALVLYYNLFNWIRVDLKRILQDQTGTV